MFLATDHTVTAAPEGRPCPKSGSLVLVDTDARVLALCRDGRVERRFRVALGRGGIEKSRAGDEKTPLGRYPLRAPRKSRRYHLFLAVGYPTPAQKARGYSGGDIGVHGPHLAFAWVGHPSAWLDWTRGCIAVGSNADIDAIAAWVRRRDAREILIQ
jgi:murein L,D-transpeptidase YafK